MKIYYKLSDQAIRAELAKGHNVTTNQTLDVNFEELSQQQRDLILRHCDLYFDELFAGEFGKDKGGYSNKAHPSSNSSNKFSNVIEADALGLEGLIATFQRFEQEAAKIEEEKKQEFVDEIMAFVHEETNKIEVNNLDFGGYNRFEFSYGPNGFRNVALLKEKVESDLNTEVWMAVEARIIALNEQYNAYKEQEAEKQRQAEKEKAAREQKRKEGVEVLRQWALQKGSEHVKLLIEENMNWKEKASREYLVAHLPEGYQLDDPQPKEGFEYDTDYEISNPSLEAIRILRAERKKNPSATLVRIKFTEEPDEDGVYYEEEPEIYHQDFVRIQAEIPDGSFSYAYKYVQDYHKEN